MIGWMKTSNLTINWVNLLKLCMLPSESKPLPFWKKSTKFPQLQNFLHLLAFLQKVTEEINKLEFAIDPTFNLIPEQTRALQELRNMDTVVVKRSYKGGNIVLMDNGYYEKMCFDFLRNSDWYRTVHDSFNAELHFKYHSIVNCAFNKGIIDKDTLEFLTVKFPRLYTFYILPKTHKNVANLLAGQLYLARAISQNQQAN